MANKFPFTDFTTEIRKIVPGLAAASDITNIAQSFPMGKRRVVEIIGKELWYRMIDYYNSNSFDPEGGTPDDELVLLVQNAMIFFTYANHFIFLELMISDEGVTVSKTGDRTSAYKYQTDEAKLNIINQAFVAADELIIFCNEQAFAEWTASAEYQSAQGLVYKSYLDMQAKVDIDNSAYYFFNSRMLIRQLQRTELKPRIVDFDTLLTAYHADNLTSEQAELFSLAQEALAHQVVGLTCRRFAFDRLPSSIRTRLNVNERKQDPTSENERIRTKLSDDYLEQALELYKELEDWIKAKTEVDEITIDPALYDDEVPEPYNVFEETDKFTFTM